jgi:hypothetical protein
MQIIIDRFQKSQPNPPIPTSNLQIVLNVCNWDAWVMTCDRLFVGRAGLNDIFSTIDTDLINPPLQILDGFYRFKSSFDNDCLIWFLSLV